VISSIVVVLHIRVQVCTVVRRLVGLLRWCWVQCSMVHVVVLLLVVVLVVLVVVVLLVQA
jgi:hypothetical protein